MSTPALSPVDADVDEGTAADRHLPEQRARLSGFAAICRVDGCGTSLAGEKRFYRRSRCCKAHALAETVYLNGEAKRFCQQCCGFHDVASFDGPRRSCRERLAAHKDRQRRKWQASHGRRGSDSGSSGGEDAGGDGHEAEQPTTVTRAGRPSRRPSLLRASTNTNTSTDSGTSPERRQAAAIDALPQPGEPAGGAFPHANTASPHSQGSYQGAGYGSGGAPYGGGGGGLGAGSAQEQHHHQQRLPASASHQALATSRRHSTLLAGGAYHHHGHGAGDRQRARRSASMSQMQARELPSSAEIWLGEHGEPLAPPQHPRSAIGPDGVPSDEVSWFPDLQAWHRSPTRGRHDAQEPDTEAALWSRRPTKRRSVPVPEAAGLAAEATEAAGGLWHSQHQTHQDLGFGAALGSPAAGGSDPWAAGRQLHQPPPLALPQQQQWGPELPVHRDDRPPQAQHFGGSPLDRQIAAAAAAAAAEPPSAHSHAAAATSAMDYSWEASIAAANVQQGLAAMAVHSGSPSDLQQDHQALAAAEELHRQANAAAEALPSSLGLSNEAEARAFASQAPEPLWLAQQLVGATMENKHRPLYSYSLGDALHPLTITGGQQPQQVAPPQHHHSRRSQPQQAWQARPPLQHTGRFASSSAPDFTHVGHTNESMHGAARAAQHLCQQQQAAERLRHNQQAAWAAQQAGMEARQAEVLAVQQELHAEYRNMQRQVGVADGQWGARGAALPNVESPNPVKRVSWSAGINQFDNQFAAARSPGTPPVAPLAMAADAPLQGGWAPGPHGQRSPGMRPGSAQLRLPVSPPQQPQHRPNSAI